MIKYILHPEYVRSKYDNQMHYITARQLIKLYKLDRFECCHTSFQPSDAVDVIHVFPREDGEYICSFCNKANLPDHVCN